MVLGEGNRIQRKEGPDLCTIEMITPGFVSPPIISQHCTLLFDKKGVNHNPARVLTLWARKRGQQTKSSNTDGDCKSCTHLNSNQSLEDDLISLVVRVIRQRLHLKPLELDLCDVKTISEHLESENQSVTALTFFLKCFLTLFGSDTEEMPGHGMGERDGKYLEMT